MGRINLITANASKIFTTGEISTFQRAAQAAEDFISTHFTFDYDVDIIVTAPSFLMKTIPEDGIGGKTYNSRLIILVVDKQQAAITEDVIFEFICHEMSHSLRWEKVPEYSDTLFKGMILEGLAVALEEKALSETNRTQKQFFLAEMQKTNKPMIDDIMTELNGKLDGDQYDYEKTFFTGDDKLIRWAGYRVGYYLVKRYLEQTGETIEQATLAGYDKFESVKL
jgi:uncharacterized protein YjaZ